MINTNPLFTGAMLADFGGRVYSYSRGNPRWKDAHQWMLNGANTEAFLIGIIPYLKLKREQATILRTLNALRKRAPFRISDEELTLRESLYQRIQLLNRKGPPATTERVDTTAHLEVVK